MTHLKQQAQVDARQILGNSLISVFVFVLFCSVIAFAITDHDKAVMNNNTVQKSGQFVNQHLPIQASNIVQLGNGWATFELDGRKFLFRHSFRQECITQID